jgi:hypothetical protein
MGATIWQSFNITPKKLSLACALQFFFYMDRNPSGHPSQDVVKILGVEIKKKKNLSNLTCFNPNNA